MTTRTDGDNTDRLGQQALECLLNRDLSRFEELLGEGVNADASPGDQSLLQWACAFNAPEFVPSLLARGADVNDRGIDDVTPVMASAFTGNAALVASLIDAGAEVNATDEGGRTALMFGARSGEVTVLQRLLDAGAVATARDADGKNGLHWAVLDGDHVAAVELLLRAGVDAHARAGGLSPSEYAKSLRRERCATLLETFTPR